MRLPASAIVVLLFAALLTACASPAPRSAGSPSPSPSPSAPAPAASADPQSTATSTVDSDDPSTWVITDRGIGPITLGAPFVDALALMPGDTRNDTDRCDSVAWWTEGAYDYDVYMAGTETAPDRSPVSVVGTSAWADPAASSGPRTTEGIGVGSSVDEVRAAYPDAVEVPGAVDSEIVHVQAGRIFFTYREEPVITAVTVTTAEMPPYELCG
ncbi:hypothetical protein MRBLWH7_001424 [Microbacterium sp. LWH7-1.2]|uniref:hypothetical protein n=1 Tax=Microbacterium sp. LWH7-1.2 TaxID=3135257 RepID=UPI0031397226